MPSNTSLFGSPSEEPSEGPTASPSAHAPNLVQIDPVGGQAKTVIRVLAAALVVCALIGLYFYFGRGRVIATGDIARVTLYPIHTVTSGKGAGPGMSGDDEKYDQLLVFAQVHVHNQSSTPLTITELTGNVGLATQTEADTTDAASRAANTHDSDRLFSAYPQLAPLRADPLLRDTTIAAGQAADGMLIFNYSLTKAQWEGKKTFVVHVTFSNGVTLDLDGTRA